MRSPPASSPAAIRKDLEQLLQRVRPTTRFLDLCLQLRRLTGRFDRDVRAGDLVVADGVELQVLLDSPRGLPVPLVSSQVGASKVLEEGAVLRVQDAPVGVLLVELVLQAGGRWDFLAGAWAEEPPEHPLKVDLQESQVDVARWFSRWLRRFVARQHNPALRKVEDPELDYAAVLIYGGRRGGKTFLATLLTWALCLELPAVGDSETIGWLVSVANTEREELDREIREFIPDAWYSYEDYPRHAFLLQHGSSITNVSADNPETLKRGRGDCVLMNEGAKMPQQTLENAIGATADRGGLVLITSNPPRTHRGAWIRTIIMQAEEAEAQGQRYPIKVFRLDHQANFAIDHGARKRAGSVLHLLNPKTAAADDAGDVMAIDDLIFHEYSRIKHGVALEPTGPDITPQLTKRLYGREFDFIAGVDFQDRPWIYASFYRARGTLDRPVLWGVGEFFLKGSEEEYLDMLLDNGFYVLGGDKPVLQEVTPHNVLWVGDASAQWQNRRERSSNAQDPPSFTFWKNRGMHIVPPAKKIRPESKYSANPPHEISYPQCNQWFKASRLHIAPHVKKLNLACQECPAKPGKHGLVAAGEHAHPVDTLRYVVWYVDPPLVRRSSAPRGGTAHAVPD